MQPAWNRVQQHGNILPSTWDFFFEEKYRIITFQTYPIRANKSALVLAGNGFIYVGNDSDDTVRCYFCNVEMRDWQLLDDVADVHKMRSPNCSMVTHIDCINVSLGSNVNNSVVTTINFAPEISSAATPSTGSTPGTVNSAPEISSATTPSTDSTPGTTNSTPGATTVDSASEISSAATPSTSFTSRTTTANSAPEISSAATPSTSFTSRTTNSTSRTTTANSAPEIASMPSANFAPEATNTQTTGVTQANSMVYTTPPTYAQLGIITEHPRHPEYALRETRLNTYTNWPKDHHMKPEDLAAAGFYYAAYSDGARCFYCGGGLRNWEDQEEARVEHARWFPKCAFIRKLMGPMFVAKVQELSKSRDIIPYSMVIESMGGDTATFVPSTGEISLKSDPAVKAILQLTMYPEKDVVDIAKKIKIEIGTLSADELLQRLIDQDPKSQKNVATAKDEAVIGEIKTKNSQLRQLTVCKICMDKEVALVFLPCGHLVSCSECGVAMKDCPMCRVNVRGVVHAFLSY